MTGEIRHPFWVRFRRHRLAVASAVILALVATLAAGAPLFEAAFGVDATHADLFARFARPGGGHILGTDEIGRDVFTRLLYGGRVSLLVGLTTAVAASFIGTIVGVVSGYFGGRIDAVLMRVTDAVIALPLLPLLIVIAAIDFRKLPLLAGIAGSELASLYRIILIIAAFGWPLVARLVRSATLSIRARDYVLAAQALGVPAHRIMLRHVLANAISPVIVAATLSSGSIILLESVLSFLGLGIQPPVPSWGNMLSNAQELMTQAPQLAIYPGLMIFVTVMAFNFLGDGLQDALDPRALPARMDR